MVRRIGKTLLWLTLASSVWLLFIATSIWSFGAQDNARKADCAIVLGAAAYHKHPSPVFKERIDHALSLYRQGFVSTIIFTGGYGTGAPFSESEVAEKYAIRQGVDANDILIEKQSRSTVDNLAQAKILMILNGLNSAIIVSDPLHLKRASIIAKHLKIAAVTSPTPTSRYRSFKAQFKFLMREVYFYHYYLLTGN